MNQNIVEPRHAASIILLRHDQAGLKALMGLRGAGHKFMPNKMVFPGGAVDDADYGAPLAQPLPPAVRARLERGATPDLALALGHAAARELAEETGLSLGEPPDLSRIDYLCRAITPPDRAYRFDARFFVGDFSLLTGTLAGSGELESLDWYLVDDMLKLDLALATRVVMQKLLEYLDQDPATRSSGPVPVLRDRGWVTE
ncbi:MAG: hypothetical protein B7Z78_02190 [Rhodospirillales bacterium 20-60-12]|nr:MAG: hypothetical protein B7Z78_02190 [Rhodospirillales bacterium 20-60-12]HQT66828.1 NUDIX hydrolase [Acetobacteraceae bacterium]HQU01386.1 NUDIX hydrolase [Acetobacteraceae bacterium]